MGQFAQEARRKLQDAARSLEVENLSAVVGEATQAYAAAKMTGQIPFMADAVRIAAHGLVQQGLRGEAIKMALDELEKFRKLRSKRGEATMQLVLAESKTQSQDTAMCEEAAQHSVQAHSTLAGLQEKRLAGESLLAMGNAFLRLDGSRGGKLESALEAFQKAAHVFKQIGDMHLQGRAMHGLAICRARVNSWELAINTGLEAIDFFKFARKSSDEVMAMTAVSQWSLEKGNASAAMQYAEQGLLICQQVQVGPRCEAGCIQAYCRAACALEKQSHALSMSIDAVSRFRQAGDQVAESIALAAAVRAELPPEKKMQLATEACMVLKEIGDSQQEAEIMCLMAETCLGQKQVDEAEMWARGALSLARQAGDRVGRCAALGLVTQIKLSKPKDGVQMALQVVEEERESCRATLDTQGEALCLLALAGINADSNRHIEAKRLSDEARSLFKKVGDKLGESAALQVGVDIQARLGRYEPILKSCKEALPVAEAAGDAHGEISLRMMMAQATMGVLEAGHEEPSSSSFKASAQQAVRMAKEAVVAARKMNEKVLMVSALSILSQAHRLAGESEEARRAANSAVSLANGFGERVLEATALVHAANAYLAQGKSGHAKQVASKALLLFQEHGDLIGEDQAKAVVDAVDNPSLVQMQPAGMMRPQFVGQQMQAISAGPSPEELRRQIRDVVSEILGMDDFIDDTPLMQAGLTSQSAVLLRNALGKKLPGGSLPFTMMFDYPSVAALTEYFVENTASEEVSMVPMQYQQQSVQMVYSGPSPEELKKSVQEVVTEIVGMDDLQADTPLMEAGLTSQSAVLLRNALGKKIPGSSLPFTMMFDYPSISALTDFFVEHAQVEAVPVQGGYAAQPMQMQMAPQSQGPTPEQIKKQVADVVLEIVGMDDVGDDTPLMQAGLTSQSAVLLRNALGKTIPGPSLPFTMMFDYPSVAALTDFFVERLPEAQPTQYVGAAPMYHAQLSHGPGPGAMAGVDAEAVQSQVRQIVTEIIGMDIEDEAALMSNGLTSQNAVLLRDALNKEFKGKARMPQTLIFDYPSIVDLAEYIVDQASR
eukprot:TRINITY_DN14850_c0_g1_i2.p1 TRINITY_DN14850_c0_g1~~TRINITY_DN14850_c0_g1_i2.p1  ORF type:complete len:1086 (+),score=289.05 TRINITY_DN14850_c0_g1_i2:86-3259(+)